MFMNEYEIVITEKYISLTLVPVGFLIHTIIFEPHVHEAAEESSCMVVAVVCDEEAAHEGMDDARDRSHDRGRGIKMSAQDDRVFR